MRCSKQFATEHGQSHLPSNMTHVTPNVRSTVADGRPIVVLELERHGPTADTCLRLRMNVREANELIARLTEVVANVQVPVPAQPVAPSSGFYVDPQAWSLPPDPRYADSPPDEWEDCGQCEGAHPPGYAGDCRSDINRWPSNACIAALTGGQP